MGNIGNNMDVVVAIDMAGPTSILLNKLAYLSMDF